MGYKKGSEKKGAKLFKTRCLQCHTIDEGGANKVGPNLYGIMGRKCGSLDGFSFSDAMKSEKLEWNENNMWEYLENPKKYIPGNKMAFAGLKKGGDRDDLVAYIAKASSK